MAADGTIYVGSNKNLYALNPNGTQKWAFATYGGVSSSAAIGADGTIYVGSGDGCLYAVYSSSAGPANSPWPMFHHDVRHTGRVRVIPAILTHKDQVKVPRGKTGPLQVKLSAIPETNVVVTVARQSGNPALSIQGTDTLTFTPANWNTYQTVQIAATPDKNDMNATAVFNLSGPGLTGKQITAVKSETGRINSILHLLLLD